MITDHQIKERIVRHQRELDELQRIHDKMVQQNQAMNQEFQKSVVQNQARYQQLTGMIAELELLLAEQDKSPKKQKDNDELISVGRRS